MNTPTEMERLARVAPTAGVVPAEVCPPDERERILDTILSSDPADQTREGLVRRSSVVGAVAGAVIVGVAVIVGGGMGGGHDYDHRSSKVAELDSGHRVVLDKIRLAVATADSGVVRVDADPGNGVLWEMWTDETSRRFRSTSRTPSGDPIYDHEVTASDGGTSVLVVSHRDRAWWSYIAPPERGDGTFHPSPDDIKAQLEAGVLSEVGRSSTPEGEEIHLRSQPVQKGALLAGEGDLWIDASSFLPKRSATPLPNGQRSVATYSWLPRTAEAVSNTRISIPPGYRQLPGPPADPDDARLG